MAYGRVSSVGVGLFDAIFRPSRFVGAEHASIYGSWFDRTGQLIRLLGIYVLNVALYASPLTLAGFGVPANASAPAWFNSLVGRGLGEPDAVWGLALAFGQNSAFLLVASALTLVTFHAGVLLTLESKGVLQTVHTIVYSTSAYLAGIFTVVWYLSTDPGVTTARDLVIALQKQFIYTFIDALGADVALPSGRARPVALDHLTGEGTMALALLALVGLYYFYSLYLGTRINHRTSRTTAMIAVAAVAVSPAIYVAGSILVVVATS